MKGKLIPNVIYFLLCWFEEQIFTNIEEQIYTWVSPQPNFNVQWIKTTEKLKFKNAVKTLISYKRFGVILAEVLSLLERA